MKYPRIGAAIDAQIVSPAAWSDRVTLATTLLVRWGLSHSANV
ncbi:MAG: hypothetical protein NTV35_03320 [Chloroflexi bacterium]|nr:hypothetical protein [Chloroflexota bacterium]